MFQLILKFFAGILLGLVILCATLQYDPALQHHITTQIITSFEKSLQCNFKARCKSLNLFFPTLTLQDINVSPSHSSDWHWNAKCFSFSFSWFDYFWKKITPLHITVDTVTAYSILSKNNLAIYPHLKQMAIGEPDIPFSIKTFNLNPAHFTVKNIDTNHTYQLSWKSHSKSIQSLFKSHIQILNGSVCTPDQKKWCEHLKGNIDIDIGDANGEIAISARTKLTASIPPYPHSPLTVYCTGNWQDNAGICSVHTSDASLKIEQIKVRQNKNKWEVETQGMIPLGVINFFIPSFPTLNGIAQVKIKTQLPDYEDQWHATIDTQKITYNGITCCTQTHSELHAIPEHITFTSSTDTPYLGSLLIKGQLQDSNVTFSGTNQNEQTYGQKKYVLAPQALHLTGTLQSQRGNAECTAALIQSPDKKIPITSTFSYENSQLSYRITADPFTCEGNCSLEDLSTIKNIFYYKNNPCVQTQINTEKNGISGCTTYTQIAPLFNLLWGNSIEGEGNISFKIWHENNEVKAYLTLEKGALRLPYTYNHIHSLELALSYDFLTQKIMICQCKGQLYKGIFNAAPSTFYLSSFHPWIFWHIPLFLDNCLLTLERGMFVVISGSLVSQKRDSSLPVIKGHLILDRAHLNEHLLSAQWLRSLIATVPHTMHETSPDILCDVSVETKEPIRVKTDLLDTNAHLRLRITGSITHPYVQGTIQLHGGHISLPYKPLYLTKAELTFDHNNSHDPHVDLVAKNLIKKHHITLQITGTLQHPQIMLESTPPLTEDEIINLLVTGIHEKSLTTAIPTLIVQSLKNLILGEQSFVSTSDKMQRLLKPLNRIHIIPRFADQTGRGGLKGAVEIDVNDRLSVLLQKNFSLYDDTRLEVEYMLSDDISLRGVRDERKDVTGEVEMKWKF